MSTILVVVAHPDDEVLGCGGTIARHTSQGDKVVLCCMTNGVSARGEFREEQLKRQLAQKAASEELGLSDVINFDFPDNQLDTVPLLTIVKSIETVIKKYLPTIIYTHFAGDLNIDHYITNRAVLTASRPQKGDSVNEIYSFEILSSTEWYPSGAQLFSPQMIVDITHVYGQKVRALNCYDLELRPPPHSRSDKCIHALATLRGNTHGFEFAEAFMVERILVGK
ncbi:GlcNAc-PI de-N-acetylase [Pseudoalteromonas sp. PS1M3]|uniref:PIG-L deacetylase family protein n=1 Tax=Pseudoalteromonas sp. PS1M3 TaxID=87791 RepID=UPI00194F3ABC|nr:PIG-L deacetylase family protein [Pseudoalteromonas sp. PS1M3]BBW92218.1 GlcNAc-PI de-N-acetylase [Pseudoalteromonas sp. PS1M3]